MISKEDLRLLIKRIIDEAGIPNQQAVSKGAGYEEKTLTQLLSAKNGKLQPAYDQLMLVYGSRLKNTTSNQVREDRAEYAQRAEIDQSDIKNILVTLANLSESHKDISASNNRLSMINEQIWSRFSLDGGGQASQSARGSGKSEKAMGIGKAGLLDRSGTPSSQEKQGKKKGIVENSGN